MSKCPPRKVFDLTVLSRLFDMDGTLVDSTAGVEGAWELFKEKYPDINIKDVLSSECRIKSMLTRAKPITACHGIRTVETLRVKCKIEDPDELQASTSRLLKSH